ncbi:MAG: ATP-dependent helicase [Deltaproteobacteria bacterium]|nr:ATP-dependent helicase [Deltaproteobacteria bacterium]MBW2019632.1 ATP-dependent helicase [Deltaproteobacteria bacterium]MBW2074447.1 ATP-dependent helicase [Deltaproteobacteria bacterium]RLB82385.1 MAG: ATP-dependent helicase [Deltaproteobacteria bacterium]
MKQYIIKEEPLRSEEKAFSIPYEEALNPAQYEAVTTLQGPLLVIAGAGSGKTRALTYRVARLVEEGVSPSAILLLTFTRKAAQEMLRRAAELLDHRCEKVAGGTFHSFANFTLRKYAQRLGFESGFNILDRADAEDAINLVRTKLRLNLKERRFPRKTTIATIYSKAINKAVPIEEVILKDYPHFLKDTADLLRLYEAYQAYKRKNLLMDYDDLLIHLRALLEKNPDVQEALSQTYHYIMVDEYQDTNKIQADIIRLLAVAHNNVMVVGDDSQSIYAFRGANFRNIMEFPAMFPGTKIVKLEENYRSTQPILNVANVIIGRAKEKYTKVLFTQKKGGSVPALVVAEDERMQSQFVTQRILELRGEGIPLNEIAVLFRSSYHSFDQEIELNKRNIPFVKVGGFKFMETAHIKDLLAHLKILANPLDTVSWHRILLLVENIGPKGAEDIFQRVASSGLGVRGLATIKPKPRYARSFERLRKELEGLSVNHLPLVELGARLLRYYEPILEKKYDDHPKRAKDLEHLLTIMERYQSLETFLSDMALEPPNASINDILATDYEDEHLVLSTIHSAKGLEWHTVFVIWALEGRFPVTYAARSDEEMEEELRLMYVAATRAKENLYFTYPIDIYDRGTGAVFSRPSRFIEGISEEILEPWYLVSHQEADEDQW